MKAKTFSEDPSGNELLDALRYLFRYFGDRRGDLSKFDPKPAAKDAPVENIPPLQCLTCGQIVAWEAWPKHTQMHRLHSA